MYVIYKTIKKVIVLYNTYQYDIFRYKALLDLLKVCKLIDP